MAVSTGAAVATDWLLCLQGTKTIMGMHKAVNVSGVITFCVTNIVTGCC